MLSEEAERCLPYSPEQLFDLVADVERYPEFLRWWISARVWRRRVDTSYTDQMLALGPLHVRFGSKTVLYRPERIDVTSDESPFRRFRLSWLFEPRPGGSCRIRLAAEIELRSHLLQLVVEQVLPAAIRDIVAAFETRAGQLYERSKAPDAHSPPA